MPIQFSTRAAAPEKARTDAVLVPVVGGRLTEVGQALDLACGRRLSQALARGDLPVKPGSTVLVAPCDPVARVLLVSFGEATPVPERAFREAVAAAARALGALAVESCLSLLAGAGCNGRDPARAVHDEVVAVRQATYRFERMKSRTEGPRPKLAAWTVACLKVEQRAFDAAIAAGVALANGTDLARDLGNLPGNVCTPSYLADAARTLAREFKLRVEVLGARQMAALKMGSLLSVARGSEQPPKLIVLQYRGGPARQAPVALVGKGITFDTGGISLKPAAEMDEMKYDMCGAASVLGTLRAVAELGLPVNVVGVIPTCENMPGGRATKPGDIVTSMSGQTIEILNTDAEGRLILCDALTYAERFKPASVVDIATLTGACVIALGGVRSGLFSPSDALAGELLAAGQDAGDPAWRMPLDDEYAEQLKSPFADVANIGGRAAGAVTAACFLARFAGKFDWAHLDIAGTAWKSGAAKGATGRPVPLLVRFLAARAGRG